MFKPRPGQTDVLAYTGGKMGISAVPGSGKTHTLSMLAAQLVASESLADDQEILIVTLVNSAVDNFASRVAGFLRELKLMPGVGYRVRTLHGLAYDIVREHPDLAGVDNHFAVVDERTSNEILTMAVSNWARSHPEFLEAYAEPGYPPEKNLTKWIDLLKSLTANFIKQSKDYQITPDILKAKLTRKDFAHPLIDLGHTIFSEYQNALANRGALDFEDLIRLAFKILVNNPDYLERLQYRWPYILEDEAQDSSLIQEKLLRLLCGDGGNWVRVGDPNQAIFETFTTADPRLLREFIDEPEVVSIDLKHSGRSTQSIMNLANRLIEWTRNDHPILELRETLSPPLIHATPLGDAQQNPDDEPGEIHLTVNPFKAADEIRLIAKSAKKWVTAHPDETIAVLVPRNVRGSELAEALTKMDVPVKEMLNSSQATRDTAGALMDILSFYVHPVSHRHLAKAALSIIKTGPAWQEPLRQLERSLIKQIQDIPVEEILTNPENAAEVIAAPEKRDDWPGLAVNAIMQISNWQRTVLLPIDQMIMTIAMSLFIEPSDLALAHKLAVILKSAAELNPLFQLPDFCAELAEIAGNKFKLYGFSEDELEFDPENYKGRVVIATIHKSKGLEWDRVYLLSVNNYDFPSMQENDNYMAERWFVRQNLNLEAECLSQLKALAFDDNIGLRMPEGAATLKARQDYCAERLRLFYVGITRARHQLVVTWNTGRRDECLEAVPLQALRSWWEFKHASK